MNDYILKYDIGDSSGDGHGQTHSGYLATNHSNAELEAAMKKFVDATGCTKWQNWFEEYEDNHINEEETLKVLKYLGLSIDDETLPFDIDEDQIMLSPRELPDFMMSICKVAIPDLTWKDYEPKHETAFFDDMGYGLFW